MGREFAPPQPETGVLRTLGLTHAQPHARCIQRELHPRLPGFNRSLYCLSYRCLFIDLELPLGFEPRCPYPLDDRGKPPIWRGGAGYWIRTSHSTLEELHVRPPTLNPLGTQCPIRTGDFLFVGEALYQTELTGPRSEMLEIE
jgi:hypothetical protein